MSFFNKVNNIANIDIWSRFKFESAVPFVAVFGKHLCCVMKATLAAWSVRSFVIVSSTRFVLKCSVVCIQN